MSRDRYSEPLRQLIRDLPPRSGFTVEGRRRKAVWQEGGWRDDLTVRVPRNYAGFPPTLTHFATVESSTRNGTPGIRTPSSHERDGVQENGQYNLAIEQG